MTFLDSPFEDKKVIKIFAYLRSREIVTFVIVKIPSSSINNLFKKISPKIDFISASNKDVINELDKNKKYLRFHLGKELPTKYVPEINFYIDDTLNNVYKINELIQKIKK